MRSASPALTHTVESADANFWASKVTNSHSIQVMRGKEISVYRTIGQPQAKSRRKSISKRKRRTSRPSWLFSIHFPGVSRSQLCVVQRLVHGLRFCLRQFLAQSCHRTNSVTASTFNMAVPGRDYNLPVMDVGNPSTPAMLSLVPKAD